MRTKILSGRLFQSVLALALIGMISGTLSGDVPAVFAAAPGAITTVAGIYGSTGYSGDGGPATSAKLNYPTSIAVDANSDLYIADGENRRIRKVDTRGIITTVAGNGTRGDSGDGGPATSAEIDYPSSIAVDTAGNLYIADDNRVRKVNTRGIITTVAGNDTQGYSGDGGPAINAEIDYPSSIAVDAAGNLYIADCGNNRVRKVDTRGIITTVAGNGTRGDSGDGGPSTGAELDRPGALAVDAAGNLYIANQGDGLVRKVDTRGIITTRIDSDRNFPGGGLNCPTSIAVDAAGNLYIADNNMVQKMYANGVIIPLSGNKFVTGINEFGNGVMYGPYAVAVDAAGNLFVSEVYGVRKVTPSIPLSRMITFIVGQNTYTVDNQVYAMDACPFISNGSALIPVRYLAAALGANTGWDPARQSVTITWGSATVELVVGSDVIKINGIESRMDAAPVIDNGRTYLPARCVSESFECYTFWDAASQTVIISLQ